MDKAAPDPLQAIRNRIDAIDEEMHRLLIDRSGVIAELIKVKGTSRPGSAFRPAREADMMRRMALRHHGNLPLFTVEHIWRDIITTFTAMQAPFGVAAGPADDAIAMRDAIRFYFGFSVAVANHDTCASAIHRVTLNSDIAVVAAASGERWWDALAGPSSPKVFARLPFLDMPGHPIRMPAFVVGPALNDSPPFDVKLLSVRRSKALEAAVISRGGAVIRSDGSDVLIEIPVAVALDDLGHDAGEPLQNASDLGGYFQPIRFLAERTA